MELIVTTRADLKALVYEASMEAVTRALRKRVLSAAEVCDELNICLTTLGAIDLKPIERKKEKKGSPRMYRREDIDQYVNKKIK